MDFRILGRVEVSTGRRGLPLGSVQQRRLLGLLLAHPGDPVSVERIIDALWQGTNPPAAPERTIQSYVSRLRGVLGDGRVLRRSVGYAIELSGARLDATEFENAVHAARGRPHAEALALLDGALSWWGGAPFGEFSEAIARNHQGKSISALFV